MDLGDEQSSADDEISETAQAAAGRRNWELAPATDYKAFTTRFDEIVEAEDLCDVEELGRLRAYLDQQMASSQSVVTRLANRLAAAADGAAGEELGIRPGGRDARRRAAGAGDRQPRPFA